MPHDKGSAGGAPRATPVLSVPVARALLIQGVSYTLILIVAYALEADAGISVAVAPAAVMQGILAAGISRWTGMARWWVLIQLVFPPAAVVVLAFHLPSWLFLACFLCLLALYWTTFRTQVPFFPSNRATWDAVEKLLPKGQPVQFVDVGSGLGGLVLHLSRLRPESHFSGIEVAPLPWLVSAMRARMAGFPDIFKRGTYERLDFSAYDVVFAYLSPAAMAALWHKAHSEMRSGTLLLSYEFSIPGVEPHVLIQPAGGGADLYGWYL